MEVAFAQAKARWVHKRKVSSGALHTPAGDCSPPQRERSASCFECPVLDLSCPSEGGLSASGVEMDGCEDFDDLFWKLLADSISQAILHQQAHVNA